MGTDYKFYEDAEFGKLTIDEISNKLEFIFIPADRKNKKDLYYSKDMDPEQMAKILLKGLTVCSYWMDIDDLKQMINNHIKNELY